MKPELASYLEDPFQDFFLESRKTALMAAEATLGWNVTSKEKKRMIPKLPEPEPLPPSNERTLEDDDNALILTAVPELQKRGIAVTHGTLATVTRLDPGRVRQRMTKMHSKGIFLREKSRNQAYSYRLRAGRQEAPKITFFKS